MHGPDYFDLPSPLGEASGSEGDRPAILHWWVGLILNVVGIFAFGVVLAITAYAVMPADWLISVGDGPRGGFAEYFILFLMFIPFLLVPILLWKTLNRQAVRRLISWTGHIRWGHMGRAALIVMIAYILFAVIDMQLDPGAYETLERQTDWRGYAILLLITLVLCPIQASSEEVFVRGYASHALVQTLVRVRVNPGVAIGIAYTLTSALFASLHLGNPESEGQVWPYMVGTFIFGIAMCALVHVEGGLESAIGYHIANNIFVFSVLGYSDPTLPDSALFWVPEIVIGWADVAWETLWTAVLVAVILWWNKRSDRKGSLSTD